MNDTTKAVLLIADISGYTKFMRLHAISSSHAKQIIVTLLKSLMQASRPPLKVAELEGDAVFFYAPSTEKDLKRTAEHVKEQVVQFFAAFNREVARLNQMNTCVCDACTRVADLKLKQVIHSGEVAIEKIERFEKLFGIDVILVHRMLKNSVPSNEYVMMTDPMYRNLTDAFGVEPERRVEDFEGVGEVVTLVFYLNDLAGKIVQVEPESVRPSLGGRLVWAVRMSSKALLDMLGIRRLKGTFKHVHAQSAS